MLSYMGDYLQVGHDFLSYMGDYPQVGHNCAVIYRDYLQVGHNCAVIYGGLPPSRSRLCCHIWGITPR